MQIALVHDWLVTEGGSEKVLKAMVELFPGPIFTLFAKSSLQQEVVPSFLQKIPGIQKFYRHFLPLFPLAMERFDLSSYDLILSSSHCVAKSIRVQPHQTHICYCHTPMRYAWEIDLEPLPFPKKVLAKPFLTALRCYDKKTSTRVDHFIANSTHVANRIEKYYGRKSTVIHPPVDTHLFSLSTHRGNYFLTCSRLVPYKRIDLLLKTFALLPSETLYIVGDGPEKKRLEKQAPKNVCFLGYVEDEVYRKILSKAKAFLHVAEEDFGIAIAEAQSAGIPVIAYGYGGACDIVVPEKTGLFFVNQDERAIVEAIIEMQEMHFDPCMIKKHAEKFNRARFQQELRAFVCSKADPYTQV